MIENKQLLAAIEQAYKYSLEIIEDSEVLENELSTALSDLFRNSRKLKFWRERLVPDDSVEISRLHEIAPILTRRTIQESQGQLRIRVPGTQPSDYIRHKTSG